jgi:hypothetical protein
MDQSDVLPGVPWGFITPGDVDPSGDLIGLDGGGICPAGSLWVEGMGCMPCEASRALRIRVSWMCQLCAGRRVVQDTHPGVDGDDEVQREARWECR